MGHVHNVYDSDTRFVINPTTRVIKNESLRKTVLIQHDHNSERFTFELPRMIEGHDMSLCDKVEVHYLNIDSATKEQKSGKYEVTDLQIAPGDEEKVICSWLISNNATSLCGSLNFLIRFCCTENTFIRYAWNTAICKDISVGNGIDASNMFEEEYVDIIEQWKASVMQTFQNDLTAWKNAKEAEIEESMAAKFHEHSAEWNQKLAVERERINQFTKLAEGSTTGDAELQDIRVGADGVTYETAGAAVREQFENVSKEVAIYNNHVAIEKNVITQIVADVVCSNSTGYELSLTENAGYGCAKIEVNGAEIYSISSINFNNAFSVVTDRKGIILGKLKEYQYNGNATVYQMPPQAKYLYLCSDVFSSANAPHNIVAMRTSKIITDTNIYNVDNFPCGEVGRICISKLYDDENGVFVKDVVDEFFHGVKPYSYNFQYLNKEKAESGYYYNLAGAVTRNADYAIFPPIRLKAGKYHIQYLSANFSHIVYESGATVKLADIVDENIMILEDDALCYFTKSVNRVAMLSNHDLPDEYAYGVYHYSPQKNFYVGSKRKYTTLREGIEAAEKFLDATVYVDAETFDLVEEFGQDYLDNYDGSEGMIGIWLKNRVHVIFASGSKVVFNYTGKNKNVHTYFSPFNAGEYGFTLENAWVESHNCRYAMHDERNSAITPYKNHYKHCTFIHDSSESSWGAHQAIGGGLGCWGDVVIEDCYVSAKRYTDVLTYHNAGYEQPELTKFQSRIIIRDCYLEGTARINATGYSTLATVVQVCGNSLTEEPHSGKTTQDATDNVVLRAWNNEIRT